MEVLHFGEVNIFSNLKQNKIIQTLVNDEHLFQ